MKKLVIGIFAHPDDETFGPGGTFAMHAKAGTDVHIITVTDGSLGGSDPNLVEIRRSELEAATKTLGIKQRHTLDFVDGSLSNDKYHLIMESIANTINKITNSEPTDVTLITFDQTGVTGHLDHIAVCMITTCLYQKLDKYCPQINNAELQYFCISDKQRPKSDKTYFVYSPCGYPESEIDLINDVSSVLDIKKQAIQAYKSQQADIDNLLATGDRVLSYESFKQYSEEF